MNRQQFEHILRASAAITGADQFVIIGSQAVLGVLANPPAELLVSIEVDLFSLRNPADAALIDGSIGEASQFHTTFGYYAHGVGEETAILPSGWRDRLIPFSTANTGGATALCLEVHDLAISKLIAGRPKDYDFVRGLVRHRLADMSVLSARLGMVTVSSSIREQCAARLARITSEQP
jgi:hypothetical protein